MIVLTTNIDEKVDMNSWVEYICYRLFHLSQQAFETGSQVQNTLFVHC